MGSWSGFGIVKPVCLPQTSRLCGDGSRILALTAKRKLASSPWIQKCTRKLRSSSMGVSGKSEYPDFGNAIHISQLQYYVSGHGIKRRPQTKLTPRVVSLFLNEDGRPWRRMVCA